eukprot:SAG11_NODE_21441_length_425_cov_0.628834_1_plen_62_part_00
MTLFKYLYTGGALSEGNQQGNQKANQDLAWLVIDVILMFFINFWQSMMVGRARKKAGASMH